MAFDAKCGNQVDSDSADGLYYDTQRVKCRGCAQTCEAIVDEDGGYLVLAEEEER